jgi:flagellar motor switch protein FliN/FliY
MGQKEQEEMAVRSETQLAAEEGKQKSENSGKPAEFTPLKEKEPVDSPGHLDFILDIPLQISVQLGGTRMLIKDLLQLGQGSVIELDKLAGEPMDILVNDRLIARGEVVVVDEKFGIRLTDVLSPTDRIQQLK